MKVEVFLITISFSICIGLQTCQRQITDQYTKQICSMYCENILIGPYENATCRNLYQMHATPHICSSKCTLIFTGKTDILRTNSFSHLINLEQVYLNDTSIQTIQNRAFSGASTTKLIDLSQNQIVDIPENTFLQLKNLAHLDLSHNKLENIHESSFSGCDSLKYIDFSKNNIQNISTKIFESMTQLQIMNLSRNSLEFMDPNWCLHFHSLKSLIFDDNRIVSLVNCTLNFNIEIFSISNNRLIAVNDSSFPSNLKMLNLSGNNIAELKNKPFKHLSKLRTLDLSKNQLKELSFELFVDLKNLTFLDISGNHLMTLKEGVFHGLGNLKFLKLRKIGFSSLEARIFYSTKNLTYIDISQNNILYLDIKSLLEFCPKLKYLKINGNSFACSDLAEVLLRSAANKVSILSGSSREMRNLNGIECFEEHESVKNNTNYKSNMMIDFFEKKFRESTFFKFFSSFKEPSQNDIRKLLEKENELLKTISEDKKLLLEFLSQQKLGQNDRTNELLRNLLGVIESNKKSPDNNNFTSDLFTILENQNRAALTAENSDMKNLISTLNNLKFMFFVCTLILVSFCVVKLINHLRSNFPLHTFITESQELPIIDGQRVQIDRL